LTSRERVIAAIEFANPDRVPRDLWLLGRILKTRGKEIRDLLKKYPLDFAYRWDRVLTDARSKPGTYEDEWGCVWENRSEGYFGMVKKHPLEDYGALKTWRPPLETLERSFAEDPAVNPEPGKFWLGWGGDFFHRVCWLRGMDAVMMDLMDGSCELYAVREMLVEFFARQVSLVAKTGVDGINFADDFGAQTQLLISPDLWRAFIRPVYEELFRICKQAGKFIFFHSDGYIVEIIEDLIEMGVNVLNCQVWCMGPEMLGERFRGRITFWGEHDRQHVISHGTPEDIFEAAKIMKEHLSLPTGGLIGVSEVDDLTPLRNIEAILRAWN